MSRYILSRALSPHPNDPAPSRTVGGALTLIGATGLALCITLLWWSMRAVMEVGGVCAQGGPYEIRVECPDHVAWLMPAAIFAGMAMGAVFAAGLLSINRAAAGVAILAWVGLFCALGWNFLELGVNPPGDGGGVSVGWLICGVVFVVMGLVPLAGAIVSLRAAGRDRALIGGLLVVGVAAGVMLGLTITGALG